VRQYYVYTSALSNQHSSEIKILINKMKLPRFIPVQEMTGMDQSNPEIVQHIRKNLIVPPVAEFMVVKYPPQDLSRGNGDILRHIFRNKVNEKNYFFVELKTFIIKKSLRYEKSIFQF